MTHQTSTTRQSGYEGNQRVGFFMETAFHYDVYQNIIAELLKQKVPCELVINDIIEPDFLNNMLEFLRTINVPGLSCTLLSVVLQQQTTYACLVSPYYIPYAAQIAKVHVRTLYGLAKESWNHAAWNAEYHSILCYSHHTQRGLAQSGNAVVVGNPRFDDWHQQRFNAELPEMLKLDPAKPTLLYAPTYGDLSSLPHWAEKLGRLSHDYNVIAKLHHGTLYRQSERNTLKLAKRHLKNIVTDNRLTYALLKKADYVLSDNSGFVFDAINADKKVILLSWQDMAKLLVNGKSLTTAESPEQKVREFLPSALDMVDLRNCLSAEYDWEKNRPQLEWVKTEYCDAFNDGMAGHRAAGVIISAIAEV